MNIILLIAVIILLLIGSAMLRRKTQPVEFLSSADIQQDTADGYDTSALTKEYLEIYEKAFTENGLSQHWNYFKTLLRPAITARLSTADEIEFVLGQSKIGGQPDLPSGVEWFKEDNGDYLSFIAQVNLEEVADHDLSDQLPHKGILYFFYSAEQEAWGFDIRDKDKFKVYYFEGNLKELARQKFPAGLKEYSRYSPCMLSFLPDLSLPNWEQSYVSKRLSQKEMDSYFDLVDELTGETNKLLGHSDNIQGPMELECELVTNGLYCGDGSGYSDPRAKELEKNKDNWILLLQVDSNEEAGMMWGDAGRLYYWIRKDDLKNQRFDRCWLISQCS